MEKTQELPKWFIDGGAQIYSTGDSVENIFSGQTALLEQQWLQQVRPILRQI